MPKLSNYSLLATLLIGKGEDIVVTNENPTLPELVKTTRRREAPRKVNKGPGGNGTLVCKRVCCIIQWYCSRSMNFYVPLCWECTLKLKQKVLRRKTIIQWYLGYTYIYIKKREDLLCRQTVLWKCTTVRFNLRWYFRVDNTYGQKSTYRT